MKMKINVASMRHFLNTGSVLDDETYDIILEFAVRLSIYFTLARSVISGSHTETSKVACELGCY